jgi:hypothetical protein
VATWDGADYPVGVMPVQITPDGTGMWVGSNRGSDRTRLVRFDLATGEETEVDGHPSLELAVAFRSPAGDPSPLIQSRATGELLGVRYLGERQVIHALDPHFAEVCGTSRNCPRATSENCRRTTADGGGSSASSTTATPRSPTSTTTPPGRVVCSSGPTPTSIPTRWPR